MSRPADEHHRALPLDLRPLGARHADYGVKAHHYELVREALLDALADVLDDTWDSQARDAWGKAYDLVAETMMQGGAGAG